MSTNYPNTPWRGWQYDNGNDPERKFVTAFVEVELKYKIVCNGREVATGLDLETAVARRREIKEAQPLALVTLMLDKAG